MSEKRRSNPALREALRRAVSDDDSEAARELAYTLAEQQRDACDTKRCYRPRPSDAK